jgi:hypothetical protein
MIYTVEMMQVEARPIAVVKRRASLVDLPIVIPDACGEVWQFIRAHQIGGTGRNVAVYLDEAINIECGVEVPPSFGDEGEVLLSGHSGGNGCPYRAPWALSLARRSTPGNSELVCWKGAHA